MPVTTKDTLQNLTALMGEEVLDRRTLAAGIGRDERTLIRWDEAGVGPPKIQLGNKTIYLRSSVIEWLKSREQHPTRTRRRAHVGAA
jgi:hypothetical protein